MDPEAPERVKVWHKSGAGRGSTVCELPQGIGAWVHLARCRTRQQGDLAEQLWSSQKRGVDKRSRSPAAGAGRTSEHGPERTKG